MEGQANRTTQQLGEEAQQLCDVALALALGFQSHICCLWLGALGFGCSASVTRKMTRNNSFSQNVSVNALGPAFGPDPGMQ